MTYIDTGDDTPRGIVTQGCMRCSENGWHTWAMRSSVDEDHPMLSTSQKHTIRNNKILVTHSIVYR